MNIKLRKEFRNNAPEELSELYEKDPNLFNELAYDANRQACIGRTPEESLKLRQMQWIIDAQLRKAKTPLGRIQIMERIFYGQVYGGDGQLAQLRSSCAEFIYAVKGPDHITGKKPELFLLKNSDDSRR